jgi:bacterioferritin
MKGNDRVLENLQMLLNGELAARDQYFAHSRKYKDWGLNKLYERLNHEMEEETEHADAIMERMLFLEAEPDMNAQNKANVGKDVVEMLKNDLATEYEVDANLKAVIAICEEEQDYDTREILVKQLDDTEMDHAYWLEKQLGLIEKVGLQNYIQSQMGEYHSTE